MVASPWLPHSDLGSPWADGRCSVLVSAERSRRSDDWEEGRSIAVISRHGGNVPLGPLLFAQHSMYFHPNG